MLVHSIQTHLNIVVTLQLQVDMFWETMCHIKGPKTCFKYHLITLLLHTPGYIWKARGLRQKMGALCIKWNFMFLPVISHRREASSSVDGQCLCSSRWAPPESQTESLFRQQDVTMRPHLKTSVAPFWDTGRIIINYCISPNSSERQGEENA